MPIPTPAPDRRLPAMRRADLLRRMFLVRHFTRRAAAVPISGRQVFFRPDEEAVAASVWAALGSADVLLPAGRQALLNTRADPVAATVVLLHEEDSHHAETLIATARRRRIPVLLCQEYAGSSPPPPGTLEGWDVEAMWAALRDEFHTLRADRRPHLFGIDTSALAWTDPITVLAARMYADHQLDQNTLQAIDSGTAARVDALIALREPRPVPVVHARGKPSRRVPAS